MFARPDASTLRGIDESGQILRAADGHNAFVRLDTGFIEQRLGIGCRADDLQMTKGIADPVDGGGFTCECGYGFVLESVAELSEPGGEVISIAERRPGAGAKVGRRRSRAA